MARLSNPKKRALWQGRFQRFLDSGLAVAQFCAVEDVSESSFYYWQKKLGLQTRRRPARTEDRGAEDHGVFRPVTVVPGTCGVVVRLPGGTRIEVDADHLDAVRAVVAETVQADQRRAADRNVSSINQADRNVSSNNQADRNMSSGNQVIRTCGGTVSC